MKALLLHSGQQLKQYSRPEYDHLSPSISSFTFRDNSYYPTHYQGYGSLLLRNVIPIPYAFDKIDDKSSIVASTASTKAPPLTRYRRHRRRLHDREDHDCKHKGICPVVPREGSEVCKGIICEYIDQDTSTSSSSPEPTKKYDFDLYVNNNLNLKPQMKYEYSIKIPKPSHTENETPIKVRKFSILFYYFILNCYHLCFLL